MADFKLAGHIEILNIQGVEVAIEGLRRKLGAVQDITPAAKSIDRVSTAAKKAKTDVTGLSVGFAGAATSAQDFADKAALALRRFTAFTIAAGTTYGIARAIFGGLKNAAVFERELIKVQQVTNGTAGTLSTLRDEIARLGVSLAAPASELADVSVTLSQAGLSISDTKKLLEGLARTRLAATFGDIKNSTEGAIAIMGQFNIPAGEVIDSLGLINAASAEYAVESDDLISATRRAGGAFSSASKGIVAGNDALAQFISLITSVRATTRQSPEVIATGLRTIIARLQRPGTADFLSDFGINIRDSEGNFVGVYEAIQKIGKALEKINPLSTEYAQIVEKVGGARQYAIVLPLLQQVALQQEVLNKSLARQNEFIKESEIPLQTLSERFTALQNAWTNFSRNVYNSPVFQFIAGQALELANALVKVLDSLSDIIPLITLIAGAKAATTFYREGVAGVLKNRLVTGHPSIIPHRATGGYIPGYGSGDKQLIAAEAGEYVIRKRAARALGPETLDKLNNVDKFRDGGYVGGFAIGGYIPGVGSGDRTPILGEAGEFVIRKRAAKVLGTETLDKLNNIDKYRMGGFIGRKKYSSGGLITSLPGYQDGGEITGKEFEQIRRRFRNIFKEIFNTRELQAGITSYEKLAKITESLGIQFSDVGNSVSGVFNAVSNEIRATAKTPAEVEKLFQGLIQAVQTPVTNIIPTTSPIARTKRSKVQELAGGGTTTGRLDLPFTATAKKELNDAQRLENLRAANYAKERRRRRELSKSIVFEKSLLQEVQDSFKEDITSRQQLAIGNYPNQTFIDRRVRASENLAKLKAEPIRRYTAPTGRTIEGYTGRIPQRLLAEEKTVKLEDGTRVKTPRYRPLAGRLTENQIQGYLQTVFTSSIKQYAGKTSIGRDKDSYEGLRTIAPYKLNRENSTIDQLFPTFKAAGKTLNKVITNIPGVSPVAKTGSKIIADISGTTLQLTRSINNSFINANKSIRAAAFDVGKTITDSFVTTGRAIDSITGISSIVSPRIKNKIIQTVNESIPNTARSLLPTKNYSHRLPSELPRDFLQRTQLKLPNITKLTDKLTNSISKSVTTGFIGGGKILNKLPNIKPDAFSLGIGSVLAQDFLPKFGISDSATSVISGALGGAAAGSFLPIPGGTAIGAVAGGLTALVDAQQTKEKQRIDEQLISVSKELSTAFKDLNQAISSGELARLFKAQDKLISESADIQTSNFVQRAVDAVSGFQLDTPTTLGASSGLIGASVGILSALTATIGANAAAATGAAVAAPVVVPAAIGAGIGLATYKGISNIVKFAESFSGDSRIYGFSDEQKNLKKFKERGGETSILADFAYRNLLQEVRNKKRAKIISEANTEQASIARQGIASILESGNQTRINTLLNGSRSDFAASNEGESIRALLIKSVQDRADLISGNNEEGQIANARTQILPEIIKEIRDRQRINKSSELFIRTIDNLEKRLQDTVKFFSLFNDVLDGASNQYEDILNTALGNFTLNQKFANPFEHIDVLSPREIGTNLNKLEDFINIGQDTRFGTRQRLPQNLVQTALSIPVLDNFSEILNSEVKKALQSGVYVSSSGFTKAELVQNILESNRGAFAGVPDAIKEELIGFFDQLPDAKVDDILAGKDSNILNEINRLSEPAKQALISMQNSANLLSEQLQRNANAQAELTGKILAGAQDYQRVLNQRNAFIDSFREEAPNANVSISRDADVVKRLTGGTIDPAEIAARISNLNARRRELQIQAQRNPSQAFTVQRELGANQAEANALTTALLQLKESAIGLTGINEELAEVEKRRSKALSLLERDLTTNPRDRIKQQGAVDLFLKGGFASVARAGLNRQDLLGGFNARRDELEFDREALRQFEQVFGRKLIGEEKAAGFIDPRTAALRERDLFNPRREELLNEGISVINRQLDAIKEAGKLLAQTQPILDIQVANTFISGLDNFRNELKKIDIPEKIEMSVKHDHKIDFSGFPQFQGLDGYLRKIAEEVTSHAVEQLTGGKEKYKPKPPRAR